MLMFSKKPADFRVKQSEPSSTTGHAHRRKWPLLLDLGVLIAMSLMLFWGTSTQFSNPYGDMTRYQCYAISFWQGQAGLQAHGLRANSQSQCAFINESASTSSIPGIIKRHLPSVIARYIASQSNSQAFHALPPEYPFLTLIPFSIPLLAPFNWYEITFALLMTLVAILIYVLLAKYQTRPAALAFAFYIVLGSWASATDRFDLIPAALTLGAVLLAGKARWKWAFALLALATLYKFYPIILVVPFLIAQQAYYKNAKWTDWRRWSAAGVFVGVCLLVTFVSLLCNANATLFPLTYFMNRPTQIESFPATLLWLGNYLGYPIQYNMAYQSLNIVSSLTHLVSPFIQFLEVAGLLYTFWLHWRGKLHLYEASLLTVLIIMITGKVFSPQYLIWVAPLIALTGRANWKWLLTWGLVGALTTFMYPFHYNGISEINQFYLVIIARDLLILALTCTLLYWYSRRKPSTVASMVTTGQA